MSLAESARSLLRRHVFLAGLAGLAAFVVYRTAWVSDDAIITFRYVWNFRHGYGAVFNVGERVQGYTHPLWFLLLAAMSVVTNDEVYAATALSLGLTVAAVLVFGSRCITAARDRTAALLVTALVVVVFVSSDSWRSFQTSGLEGALSTFLVVLFATDVLAEGPAQSPARIVLSGSLLALCRPDFSLIVTAPCAVALMIAARTHRVRQTAAALIPLLGFGVSRWYYGELLPNTGAAKLGIFTPQAALHQGSVYLLDWAKNEPITVFASCALFVFGLVRLRGGLPRALGFGLIAYDVYVVAVGGDFMRGRFLVPVFVGSCAFGGIALARTLDVGWRVPTIAATLAGLGAFALAASAAAPAQTRTLDHEIANERIFFLATQSLSAYRANGRLAHEDVFDLVRPYLDACGNVTVHSQHPGALGYYLGPRLTVIDTLGLTDRFIAHLPRANLRYNPPRPGHPYRRLPYAYLARRGDVSIVSGWEAAMRKLDCSLPERVKPFEDDPSLAP